MIRFAAIGLRTWTANLVLFSALFAAASYGNAAERASAGGASVEWPQWRGPKRDGISTDTGLLKTWPDGGPKLAWKATGLGEGFSSISISHGRIFTMGDRDGEQYVIALSLDDNGKELWATKIGKGGGGDGYPGPRCTPTVDGDHLYAIGIHGALACLEVDSGDIVWQKDLKKDFGGRMMSGWGYSESPLVDGEKLVCTPGAKDAAVVALDKSNGDVIWKASVGDLGEKGRDGAAYSSIVVSHGGGVKQYVQLMGRGLVSFRADDGELLWNYNRIANGTASIPTPIVDGDYVFSSTGYGAGAALVELSSAGGNNVDAKEVYFLEARTLQNHHGGMVLVDGYLYGGNGHNQGYPVCVEFKTGKIAWNQGRGAGTGSAAIGYADGHLYFRYQNGVVALVEASPAGYKLKGKFQIPDVKNPSWPHPVIVGGKLYLREQDALLCYDVSE